MFPVFIVPLHHYVASKRIRGLSLYRRFYPVVVLFPVYILFDILGTQEKGPKCVSVYLHICAAIHQSVNSGLYAE